MNTLTRREMISTTVLTAGALVTGCGRAPPLRNERMAYRPLGKTGLNVSVIGFGGEWMERADQATCTAVTRRCEEHGINILDCWMSNPEVRTKLGNAIAPNRKRWIIQGHYLALKHHAGECSGCRRCEGRCPFKVKISERMQAAAKLFGR